MATKLLVLHAKYLEIDYPIYTDAKTGIAASIGKDRDVRTKAEWQSGYAPDCKSVYLGSTPGSAST